MDAAGGETMLRHRDPITITSDSARPRYPVKQPPTPPPTEGASLRPVAVHLAQGRLLLERQLRSTPYQNADQLRLLSHALGRAVDWLERWPGGER